MSQNDLAGQVGIVTGAARGLGRAFALGLAQGGMSVAITDRREDEMKFLVWSSLRNKNSVRLICW